MRRALGMLLFLLLACAGLVAQQTGTTSFGAADAFTNDSIDLATLTPSVRIPVLGKKGAFPFTLNLFATSSCSIGGTPTLLYTYCSTPYTFSSQGMIGLTMGYTTVQQHGTVGDYCYQYFDFYVAEPGPGREAAVSGNPPTGTYHYFPHSDTFSTCPGGSGTLSFTDTTIDSSGFTATVSITWVEATNPTGTLTYNLSNSAGHYTEQESTGATGPNLFGLVTFNSETDSFGNKISYASPTYTDTLNTTALTALSGSSGYQWFNASGTGVDLNITEPSSGSFQRGSNFNCVTNNPIMSSMPSLSYGYPDGTSIATTMESTGSGKVSDRIGSVTLRTGATITYAYGPFNCGTDTLGTALFPTSLTRTTPDGTTTYTMNYSAEQTTVVTPDGNKTVYTFGNDADSNPNGIFNDPLVVTEKQTYQNTGTVSSPVYALAEIDTYCYNGSQINCQYPSSLNNPPNPVMSPITQRDVYRQVFNTAGTSSVTSRTTETFDVYGNTTSVSRYDFGASGWTTQTTTAYGTWNGSGCTNPVGSSIYDLPCDTITTDGTHTLSETRNTYNTSGARLTSSAWTGTTWLTTTYMPNSNGTVASVTTANGLVTTFSQTGGCNGLFNTGVSIALPGDVLTGSTGWNCDMGSAVSSTDANGNTVSETSFDSMLRVLSSTDESGLVATKAYTSNSATSTVAFSTYSSASTTTVDPLGRPVLSQTTNGSQYDTVSGSHQYSGINFVEGSSAACSEPQGTGCSITMNAYKDALGRTVKYTDGNGRLVTTVYSLNDVQTTVGPAPTGENAKVTQVEYDGLGRIKSTCALETSGGTACGQAMGGSGVLTTYTYSYGSGTATVVAVRAGESKTSTVDALGRALSMQTPEETSPYTYTYDTTAGSNPCGAVTSMGDLISENVAGMYTRCYKHDLLHRVTDVTTTLSGSYCRRFRYDNSLGVGGALPSGVTLANNLGRMVEAETDNCAPTPVTITDEWFSYDKNGRTAAVWELTPTQSSYYKSSVTYFLNGAPETLTIPGYNVYYGLDSNGRWSTAKWGSSLPVVSAVTYGPQGPTSISIGSGTDEDTYLYDANTGAMKQYQFFVGSANYKGQLSWNPIGSIGSLTITDGFNSSNSQVCTYTHDDVSRLTSDSCGSNWSQTFSYDQYDNLTKAGSAAFNPGYNTLNQYTFLPSNSYDAAGNLLFDGTNHITWDGFGKMQTFAGVTYVYDALGRSVRNAAGTDILYGPLGKIGVITHPSTYGNTYIPLPGGGAFSVPHSHYIHRDQIGSSSIISTVPASGNGAVASDLVYAPYGDQYGLNGTVAPVMFGGNASDLNSGLYDTPNRELSFVGRWESVDPAHASWNGYAYVTDPTIGTDTSGLIGLVRGAMEPCSNQQTCTTGTDWVDDSNQILWNGGAGLDILGRGRGGYIHGLYGLYTLHVHVKEAMPLSYEEGLEAEAKDEWDANANFIDHLLDALISSVQNMQNMSAGCDARCDANGYVVPAGDPVGNVMFFGLLGPGEAEQGVASFWNVVGTKAEFQEVDSSVLTRLGYDHMSPISASRNGDLLYSFYIKADGGMYRISNHWGLDGISKWSLRTLDGSTIDTFTMTELRVGFVRYSDMQFIH
jgi:RHS repeat-associated protein